MALIPFFAPRHEVSITQTDAAGSSADASAYTFSSKSFGAAAADRIVAAAIITNSVTASSVVIGGINATIVQASGTNNHASIAYASVPIGTVGDVVVTPSSSALLCGIVVYRIVGARPAVHDTDNPTGGGTDSRSITIDVPVNGGVVAAAAVADLTVGTFSVGGVTETEQAAEGNIGVAGGHLNTATLLSAHTITYSSCRAICGVSWRSA